MVLVKANTSLLVLSSIFIFGLGTRCQILAPSKIAYIQGNETSSLRKGIVGPSE
jgi:hypothetical protein